MRRKNFVHEPRGPGGRTPESQNRKLKKSKIANSQKSKTGIFCFAETKSENQKSKGSREPLLCLCQNAGKVLRLTEFQYRP
jgi:hypothetical protein